MGTIETTYNQPQTLTTFKAVGKMQISDFYECLDSYYAGGVTPLTLWDLSDADVLAITTDEIINFAQYSRNIAEARKGGKTAIVFSGTFDYGLGRMLETHMEIAGLPLVTHVCLSIEKAKQWLGINESMVAKSMIYKIGSCIQKKETGKLDRGRTLHLIHELSTAIKLHNDQDILVDLRNAEVQTDTSDLMSFAAECAKYGSDFDKRIAILIPNTLPRIETARLFKSCMDIIGFRLRQFFDYESAIEWLSEERSSPHQPQLDTKCLGANNSTLKREQ